MDVISETIASQSKRGKCINLKNPFSKIRCISGCCGSTIHVDEVDESQEQQQEQTDKKEKKEKS